MVIDTISICTPILARSAAEIRFGSVGFSVNSFAHVSTHETACSLACWTSCR